VKLSRTFWIVFWALAALFAIRFGWELVTALLK
jgi:hypothetical protein